MDLDKVTARLHKVRTGSGSDRVVSETPNWVITKSLIEKTKRFPHAFRPGRYRSRFWLCV